MTGTRADYGHLYWVLREILDEPSLELQLVVTGAHLSDKWGHTVDQIERDGFPITYRVPFALDDDSPAAVAESMAQVTSGLARAFVELSPDVIVVLGDRYEVLAAAQAALILGIPLAHLHGGETTEGAFDEAIRHAVTKMAHLHFVAADEYANRVRQLGESENRVFTVGAP
jgi:UDP-hydrolysing UDP-N-acetyl-D-glucosamine 2-epimerase